MKATEFRRELAERSMPAREIWWGYDSLQIDDPDGNELIFPVEGNSETSASPPPPQGTPS